MWLPIGNRIGVQNEVGICGGLILKVCWLLGSTLKEWISEDG